jgi:hypothetical protein
MPAGLLAGRQLESDQARVGESPSDSLSSKTALEVVQNARSPLAIANELDVFLSSELVDAGTGFEPVTFRL